MSILRSKFLKRRTEGATTMMNETDLQIWYTECKLKGKKTFGHETANEKKVITQRGEFEATAETEYQI